MTSAEVGEWRSAVRWVVRRFKALAPDEWDDAEQEAWIEIMASWKQFDASIGSPRWWIFRHARLGVIHYLRSGKRASEPVSIAVKGRRKAGVPVRGGLPDLLPDRAPDDPFAVHDLIAAAQREAGRAVTERERELLTLVFHHGLSYADVAQLRGQSKSAVTVAMRRLFPWLVQAGARHRGRAFKLTAEQTEEAARLRSGGVKARDVADRFGVSEVTLFRALRARHQEPKK